MDKSSDAKLFEMFLQNNFNHFEPSQDTELENDVLNYSSNEFNFICTVKRQVLVKCKSCKSYRSVYIYDNLDTSKSIDKLRSFIKTTKLHKSCCSNRFDESNFKSHKRTTRRRPQPTPDISTAINTNIYSQTVDCDSHLRQMRIGDFFPRKKTRFSNIIRIDDEENCELNKSENIELNLINSQASNVSELIHNNLNDGNDYDSYLLLEGKNFEQEEIEYSLKTIYSDISDENIKSVLSIHEQNKKNNLQY